MKLNLYDENLNRIAIIGDQFVSCYWSEGYNSTERFTLEVGTTEEFRRKLRPNCYVGRTDRKTVMVIKSVVIGPETIVASGQTADRILDDVALVGTVEAGESIDTAVRMRYNESNGYRGLSIAETNLGVQASHPIGDRSFLDAIHALCVEGNIGFTVERDGGGLTGRFYAPQPKPNLVFARMYGNLALKSVKLSTEIEKNYAIVLGDVDNEGNVVRVDVDLSGGSDRREIVLKETGIVLEPNETAEQYVSRLYAFGVERLLASASVQECEFELDDSGFGTEYDLGDVITVLLPEYKMKFNAKIARITQKEQRNRTTTTVEVGDIIKLR